MSFSRYPAYKESGIDWLGVIPQHWSVMPLARIASGPGSLFIDGDWVESKDLADEGIRYITTGNVGEGKYKEQGSGYISQEKFDELRCTEVLPGDVLISRLNLPIGRACVVSDLGERIITSVDNVITRPDDGYSRTYLAYMLSSAAHFANMEILARGTTMQRISRSALGQVRFAFPSPNEQMAIASFLDRETAKIDTLVAEQEQLITLLKEKRQAVISHAVTKGLDTSVPMKDSGVEWLGEVPSHWEVTHLKRRCALVTDGAHISPETEGGVHLFVSTKDISDDGIDFDGALRTSPASYEYMVKTGCQPASGDVLFSKDGTIGRTVVVNGATEFVIASSLIIIRPIPDQLNSDFLNALCQSWVVSQQVDGFVKGAGLPRLSIQNLLKVVGVFPPIDEQVQIANYLSDLDMRSRTLALEAERTVALLKERRSALISAAVTGQIDVRGSS